MASDFDPFKDFAYGDLNPILPKGGKVYRDNETSGINVLKNIAAESYSSETLLGTGPYKAICLRVESATAGGAAPGAGAKKNSWLDRVYSIFGGEPTKKFIEVKAIIPEIHGAMYPIPSSYEDHSSINRYPTFTARQSGTGDGDPAPGDVIWVDFGNRILLQDPQYLGKLESDIEENIAKAAASGAFNCGRGLSGGGSSGDSIQTTQQSVSKLGPTIAPDYQPLNIERERGKIPKGKGAFLGASLNPLKLSKYPVKVAKDAGIGFVSIYVYKIKKNGQEVVRNIESIREFIKEYHKNGIKCYVYGWATIGAGKGYNEKAFKAMNNNQEPEDMFIKNLINIAIETGAVGVEIDAEEETWAKGTSVKVGSKWMYSTEVINRNENFARRLSEQCKKYRLSFGYTSTTPSKSSAKHGHYFASWAKYCDYVIPQVYSGSGFWGPKHWVKGYKRYLKEGFKNIIPGLGAYDVKGKGKKEPGRMRWELHQCYGQNLGWADAVTWWSWDHLNKRNRWSVVAELGGGKPKVSKPTTEKEAQVSSPSSPGQTSTASVSTVGPTAFQTPVTEVKNKSAEVIKEKPANITENSSRKDAEIAEKSKDRDFSKNPITREELFAFTKEKPQEIDRLLSITGPTAIVSPHPSDIQKLESLKSEAKNNIVGILKKGSKKSKILILEAEIIGVKKEIKLIDVSGTTTPELAALKSKLKKKEKKLKKIVNEQKESSSSTGSSGSGAPCHRGRVGGGRGPTGARIPLSKFSGGAYSKLVKDDLAVELPSRKRKSGVNQIMIHQSGVHTTKSTVKILAKKGLSVHYTIDLYGKVRQHVALDRTSFHAATAPGEQNERTIGIEMVNRYIPDLAKYSIGNQPILVNSIFTRGYGPRKDKKGILPPTHHKTNEGRVRMPSKAALEACWQLCKWLPTQISTLKLAFPGLTSKGFLWTGGNSAHLEKRFDDGIVSHGRAIGTRWDGLFTEHYMMCRNLGIGSDQAFKRTIAAATWTKPVRPRANKAYTQDHKGVSYLSKYLVASTNPNAKTWELKIKKK